MLKMAAKVGLHEVVSPAERSRLEQAKVITESLSQLKGAAMKAGQLISLDASEYFPPEAIEILSKLQNQAQPMKFEDIRRVLLEDLGQERLSQFKGLHSTPAGAASIGQVHRALLNGQDVAIKIQYPGVRESIDSDLKVLKKLAGSLMSVTGRSINLDPVFDELATVLHQEADYLREAELMQRYKQRLDQSDLRSLRLPSPLMEHTTHRVLTMDWMQGRSVADWLRGQPPIRLRERLGHEILELYCQEFFSWGLVQTDPNFGNYLIDDADSENPRWVLIDFGSTLTYDEEFRSMYVELLKALSTLSGEKILEQALRFGLLDSRESEQTKQLFVELMLVSVEPFMGKVGGTSAFHFRSEEYAQRSRDVGRRFAYSLKFSPPPRKIIFLHRKLGGLFVLLKAFDISLDVGPYWERMAGSALKPASPAIATT
jgi:aarF domain-containing kinase